MIEEGTKINLLGVWQSVHVPCDDDACPLGHFDNRPGLGRHHIEDGPREGRPGVVVALEPNDRALIQLDGAPEGATVSCDLADLEVRNDG